MRRPACAKLAGSAPLDAEFIRELFAEFGPVQVRRMFSGAGVYADGVMFALIVRDQLHLKADEQGAQRFAAEGCGPFEYTRNGKRTALSYWRIPDRLYDDPTELAAWARTAHAVARAARRTSVKPRGKSRAK